VLNIGELLQRTVGSLSGGQQRRADLARALMIKPEVLFLDEPTSGLDIISQREFWSALDNAQKNSKDLTIVCASHHGNELSLFDRFVFLENGEIQLDVARSTLIEEASHETIEISTSDCFQLRTILKTKLNIDSFPMFNNRLMSHSNSAAETLDQMKALTAFETLVDAVTVRRTSLADVILKKLLDFSASTENRELLDQGVTEAISCRP
jgi:ABC-type multidrug transport system ATPase subunit